MSIDPRGDAAYSQYGQNKQWLYLCLSGPMAGAMWGGTAHAQVPGSPTFAPLGPVIHRMMAGAYLAHAGADRACYFADEPVTVGAEAALYRREAGAVSAEVEIRALGNTPQIQNNTFPLSLSFAQDENWGGLRGGQVTNLGILPPGEYLAQIQLLAARPDVSGSGTPDAEESILDTIEAPFRVLPRAKPRPATAGVRVLEGEFVLNGKPWRPVGVNYWPLWVAGDEDAGHLSQWLAPDQYDPVLVEADLARCERLGVNLVSIQYRQPNQAPALNDFLAEDAGTIAFVLTSL